MATSLHQHLSHISIVAGEILGNRFKKTVIEGYLLKKAIEWRVIRITIKKLMYVPDIVRGSLSNFN